MRRIIFPLLIGIALLFSSCSIPIKQSSSDVISDITQLEDTNNKDTEPVVVPENQNEATPAGSVENIPKLTVTLYYQDADGYVIPVTRHVVKQEGIAKLAVNGLIDSSASREELDYFGLYPVLPPDTQILGMTIKEGLAVIDFNEAILDYDTEKAERSIVSSIVYTLTEFKTIKRVKILVKGKALGKMKFGTDASGELGRDNLLINAKKINVKKDAKKIDVYYFKSLVENCVCILPVSFELSGVKPENIDSTIFNSLAKVSAGTGLLTEIPAKARLLSYSIKDGILTLNFNGEFKKYGGNTREDGIINQILLSAGQIEGIKGVKILINGKEDTLPEGTEISGELPLLTVINDFVDT